MKNDINLQDAFLNVVRQQGQVITVILMNGYQMRGVIRGFDSFIVMLESDGRQQMIYKHAISTMIPTQGRVLYPTGGTHGRRIRRPSCSRKSKSGMSYTPACPNFRYYRHEQYLPCGAVSQSNVHGGCINPRQLCHNR